MLKKYGILILLLLLCLTGCGGAPAQADSAPAEENEVMYYHSEEALWEIAGDGTAEKLSEESCSICVDGVVYEVFGTGGIVAKGDGEQEETWGVRVNGEVIYEEHYYFEDRNDIRPLISPLLLEDDLQVVGEYIYFMVFRKDEAGARLCRIPKDGSDIEIYEDFLIRAEPLLSDSNTVLFLLLNEKTTLGYPAKLDQGSGEAVVLAESEADIAGAYWISSGKVWWQTSTDEDFVYDLHSARVLGGEMEEYPDFSGVKIWTVAGAKVYYQQGSDLYAWDFTAMETSVYPGCLTESRGLVEVCRWGGLLIDTTGEKPAYWLLDFDTGELLQVNME